jgi:hypothetical protein
MKKLYICGDSFACADPECPIIPWSELLVSNLGDSWEVENLSMVCASNLTIRMQVDRAIENQADFIIVMFTSSIRDHGRKTDQQSCQNLLDDFFRIGINNNQKRLACWSYNSLNSTCVMPPEKIQILKDFYTDIFDIDLAIYQNQCIIESTLHKLLASQTPFVFDQGGFENPKFDSDKLYFTEFDQYRSQYNLWQLAEFPMQHRPYFHIKDQKVHQEIVDYYKEKILCSTQ